MAKSQFFDFQIRVHGDKLFSTPPQKKMLFALFMI